MKSEKEWLRRQPEESAVERTLDGARLLGHVFFMQQKSLISIYYLISYSLLWFGYSSFVIPVHGYSGFEWYPNTVKIIEGVIFVLIISFMLPTKFSKPSDIFLHLQAFFPILPMLVLYGAADLPGKYVYYALVAFGLIVVVSRNVRLKALIAFDLPPALLQKALLIISAIYILSIVGFGGLRYLNFDFSRVYEFRAEAASGLPKIYGYFSPMVSKVLLPFALIFAVANKSRFFALAAMTGSMLMFGLTNHKGPIFYPLAALALYFILQRKKSIQWFLVANMATILVSSTAGGLMGSLLLRRSYFIPAHLNFLYYDFFSVNPHLMWAESKITFGILDSLYDLDSTHLIGFEYYSSVEMGANTGWIGSGYMQLGFAGMMIYAFIIGLLFSLLDAYSQKVDKRVIVSMTLASMTGLLFSSDLPTAFLTHGILLALLLLSSFSMKQGSDILRTRLSFGRAAA